MEGRFTQEELELAKSVDLTAVAQSLGYTVKRVGRFHTLKEMDSIRIYDRQHWFRWSKQGEKGNNGGSQIDFLRVFTGMGVKEAVFWLLDFAGYARTGKAAPAVNPARIVMPGTETETEKKPFVLPPFHTDNRCLYRYLSDERCIRREVINYFVKRQLIYESSSYHDIVFRGNDKDGITRFASRRGVHDRRGKAFKCDVAGSDKNYGFNVAEDESMEVVVFEACIDLMSYMDIFDDFATNKLALGMVCDRPLATFLEEHPQVGLIRFCLDNDKAGREATKSLMEKYYGLGYDVEDYPAPAGYKDYNEWLAGAKRGMERGEREQKVKSQ